MILAIDAGTTGVTCLVVDGELRTLGRGSREIRQFFPRPGWVEHDPEDIWQCTLGAAEEALADARLAATDLDGIGIANQRETTVVWERDTGAPLHRAIVWQDRRTAERCRQLPADLVRERTGLVPDPYFSATKLEWILGRSSVEQKALAFGTVDSWIVWKLTRGAAHVTDATNASRTMLVDLRTLEWDEELLELFGVDPVVLPRIVPSSERVAGAELLGATVPIAGIAGDQQSALFGHGCFEPGDAKATYGTGSFVLVNVGTDQEPAPPGLLKTAAATPVDAPQEYAVEGAVLTAGAVIDWLRDGLQLVESASETEETALRAGSTDGVYFVPALTGLGSPHWDPDARGLITGLTRGTTRAHLVRAALESVALQIADVLEALPSPISVLRADGGASSNAFLMQLQADLVGCPVEVSAEPETTALGAAALAGLALGVWPDTASVAKHLRRGMRYEPARARAGIDELREGWRLALRRALLR